MKENTGKKSSVGTGRPPGRPKGYPKTGGRKKGVPNEFQREVKELIRAVDVEYITSGKLEEDLNALEPAERVDAHIRLMKFHTSEERSQQVDVSVSTDTEAIDITLARLLAENEE